MLTREGGTPLALAGAMMVSMSSALRPIGGSLDTAVCAVVIHHFTGRGAHRLA